MGFAPVRVRAAADTAAIAGDQRPPLGDRGVAVVAAEPDGSAGSVEQHRRHPRSAGDVFEHGFRERGAVDDERRQRSTRGVGEAADVDDHVELMPRMRRTTRLRVRGAG
ncbi:MAG: hypothetical protein R2695_10770 [Acidimicrobiales bacterium]